MPDQLVGQAHDSLSKVDRAFAPGDVAVCTTSLGPPGAELAHNEEVVVLGVQNAGGLLVRRASGAEVVVDPGRLRKARLNRC